MLAVSNNTLIHRSPLESPDEAFDILVEACHKQNDNLTPSQLESLRLTETFFERVLSEISHTNDFSRTFEEILKKIPYDFFDYIAPLRSLTDVDANTYQRSIIYTEIIDKVKQAGYRFILNRERQKVEKLIQNLQRMIQTAENNTFSYHIRDVIEELKTLLEAENKIPHEFPKNNSFEEAAQKTHDLAKTVLKAVEDDKSTLIRIQEGNASVISASNTEDKKVVFKGYSNPYSQDDIETIQHLFGLMNFNKKAFPPSIRPPTQIPISLSYEEGDYALIEQGYASNDKNIDPKFLVFLMREAGFIGGLNELKGFIVPEAAISPDIFAAEWTYTDTQGKPTKCSFKELQKLYLLKMIEITAIWLRKGQTRDALKAALDVKWQIINENDTLVQKFVNMWSLFSFPAKSVEWIHSHLVKEVPSQILKAGEYGLYDLYDNNKKIQVVKNEEYKELNKKEYSYIKTIKKEEGEEGNKVVKKEKVAVENVNLETLHEDYLKHSIHANTPVTLKGVSLPLKDHPSLLKTLDNVEFRFVFFDLDNGLWYDNTMQRYTFNGEEHYKLPLRVQFEGINKPLSNEDIDKLKNSLYDDIQAYTWLSKNRTSSHWTTKIIALTARLFSRTEMLTIRDLLILNESNLEILLARLERFILSPRSSFSTRERLEHWVHWQTFQQKHASLQEIQQWRDQLLEETLPSCLNVFKTMFPLLADVIELIKTVYPDEDPNQIVGHYLHSVNNLIGQSNQILKDPINQHRNAYIEKFLDPRLRCLGAFGT